ncbi:MAG: hypothetical protein WBV82_04305 [Myxococcaceae bacterium]
MIRERLQDLGFTFVEEGTGTKAAVELVTPLLNPLTRGYIDRVTFRVVDEHLVPQEPVELAGLPPVSVEGLRQLRDLERHLRQLFDDCILTLQRRCSELQALGIQPRIQPASLDLRAEVEAGSVTVEIASDKQGNFRVARVRRGAEELPLPEESSFELSEFRDGAALLGYLEALIQEKLARRSALDTSALTSEDWGAAVDLVAPSPEQEEVAPPVESEVTFVSSEEPSAPEEFDVTLETGAIVPPVQLPAAPVTLGDLARRFGEQTVMAQRSAIELVADLTVDGVPWRFAASRVAARSFRGLLAGPVGGKLWAGRFELDAFPGLVPFVAEQLNVPVDQVSLTGIVVDPESPLPASASPESASRCERAEGAASASPESASSRESAQDSGQGVEP